MLANSGTLESCSIAAQRDKTLDPNPRRGRVPSLSSEINYPVPRPPSWPNTAVHDRPDPGAWLSAKRQSYICAARAGPRTTSAPWVRGTSSSSSPRCRAVLFSKERCIIVAIMSKELGDEPSAAPYDEPHIRRESLADTGKSKWERLWPVIACGAGLFSDGYLNGVIGSVSTMLLILYPKQYSNSPAQSN